MTNSISSQRLAAEALGTAFLLAAIVGSGIMAERLSGGNVGIELLANAIATGATLVVLITMLGPISGAHFNPAVTVAFFQRGDMESRDAIVYALVQVVAAIAGVIIAHAMFDEALLQLSTKARSGTGQWVSECVATFGLVTVIFLTLKARAEAVPMAVGLYIMAAIWFTGSTSFANPAVTIARAITDTFAGIDPTHVPAFITAQLAGALLATWFCDWLTQSPQEHTSAANDPAE